VGIYLLGPTKYKGVKNLPCITINYLSPKVDLTPYVALIFTSKNSVVAIDKIDPSWQSIPSYSIGRATSSSIVSYGGNLVYEATASYADSFAKEIQDRLYGKKVLFLRAKTITSSINTTLKDSGVLLDEIVVYETLCSKCSGLKAPEDGSCIIFSSPSTIECFFRCFEWRESYKAVIIGRHSANYFPKGIPYTLSDNQDIDSCIKKCSYNIIDPA
jgi:uroporphyrinogen-III synthase